MVLSSGARHVAVTGDRSWSVCLFVSVLDCGLPAGLFPHLARLPVFSLQSLLDFITRIPDTARVVGGAERFESAESRLGPANGGDAGAWERDPIKTFAAAR